MLDTFVSLAVTAGTIGKVTAASLYPSGFIAIEVIAEDGKPYTLTYMANTQEAQNGDSRML